MGDFLEWFGEEFESYPTEKQMKEVWDKYSDRNETKRHYMRVEKQFRFDG